MVALKYFLKLLTIFSSFIQMVFAFFSYAGVKVLAAVSSVISNLVVEVSTISSVLSFTLTLFSFFFINVSCEIFFGINKHTFVSLCAEAFPVFQYLHLKCFIPSFSCFSLCDLSSKCLRKKKKKTIAQHSTYCLVVWLCVMLKHLWDW